MSALVVILAGIGWLAWHMMSGAVFLRQRQLRLAHGSSLSELTLGVVSVLALCTASLTKPLLKHEVFVLYVILGAASLVPPVAYRLTMPKDARRDIVTALHLTMYCILLSAVPWAFSIVSFETGAHLFYSGVALVWLIWARGYGLWPKSLGQTMVAIGVLQSSTIRLAFDSSYGEMLLAVAIMLGLVLRARESRAGR